MGAEVDIFMGDFSKFKIENYKRMVRVNPDNSKDVLEFKSRPDIFGFSNSIISYLLFRI